MYRHRKYIVEPSRLGGCLIGDRWDPVNAELDTPLVILFGDNLPPAEYRVERVAVLHEKVFGEFRLAVRGVTTEASLLALPFHPAPASEKQPLEGPVPGSLDMDRLRHLTLALQEECDVDFTSVPTSLIGHGAGAFLAMGLALNQPNVHAVTCMGGEGMDAAMTPHGDAVWERLRDVPLLVVTNEEDPFREQCRGFAERLRAHGLPVMEEHPTGGHPLDDYLGNGSLRDAFTFSVNYLPD